MTNIEHLLVASLSAACCTPGELQDPDFFHGWDRKNADTTCVRSTPCGPSSAAAYSTHQWDYWGGGRRFYDADDAIIGEVSWGDSVDTVCGSERWTGQHVEDCDSGALQRSSGCARPPPEEAPDIVVSQNSRPTQSWLSQGRSLAELEEAVPCHGRVSCIGGDQFATVVYVQESESCAGSWEVYDARGVVTGTTSNGCSLSLNSLIVDEAPSAAVAALEQCLGQAFVPSASCGGAWE